MRRIFPVLVAFLLLVIPAQIFAKGVTVKITIKGAGLRAPIEITDPKVLANFGVWSGSGTSSTAPGFNPNAPSFVVDWSQGAIAEPPNGLPWYEVSFFEGMPNAPPRLVYVVSYSLDTSTGHGYIYLPGKGEESYWLNVRTISRGVEGKWFHAWGEWDKVAGPLIVEATSYPDPALCPPRTRSVCPAPGYEIFDPPFPPADLPLTAPLPQPYSPT